MKVLPFFVFLLLIIVQDGRCRFVTEIVLNGNRMFVRDVDDVFEQRDIDERKAVIGEHLRWPNGVVSYEFGNGVTDKLADIIRGAFKEWELFTCLMFLPKTDEVADYITIHGSGGTDCNSRVGMEGGQQILNLQTGCHTHATALHELGHVIGLHHEHKRPDRDDFVTIKWENIKEKFKFAFRKMSTDEIDTHGTPYDYYSIMHYHQWQFSKNDKRTIKTADPYYQNLIGEVVMLSLTDIQLANIIYQCPERWYRIHHTASGKVLDSYNGVALFVQDQSDSQLWSFDGKKIKNKQFPGKVLAMEKVADGDLWADVLLVDPKDGETNQEWKRSWKGLQNESQHKEFVLGNKSESIWGSEKSWSDNYQEWTFEAVI